MDDTSMDGLAAFLQGRTGATSGAHCPAARLVDDVRGEGDDEVADQLAKAMMDPDVPIVPLHAQLRKARLSIARDSITQHRRGSCTCEEES
jgi:hypothetical protein